MSTQRTVTVYSTKGGTSKRIQTDARTWGQLKPLVSDAGYDLNTLAAADSVRKTTLEHQDATLPEGNFTLFLRPTKTKSGLEGAENMDWKQLRERIAKAINEDGEEALDHFNSHSSGKNFTQLSTPQLRELVSSYNPGQVEEEEEWEEEEDYNDEEEGYTAEDFLDRDADLDDLEPVEQIRVAKQILAGVCNSTMNHDVCERINEVNDVLEGAIADLGDTGSSSAQVDPEQARLAQEARDFESGF